MYTPVILMVDAGNDAEATEICGTIFLSTLKENVLKGKKNERKLRHF